MEDKEEKKKEEEKTFEKAFWIIGIAIIVFLIILGGVLIGLKITRDGVSNVDEKLGDNNGGTQTNYSVLEDGQRLVTNKEVTNFSVEVEGRKFSNFVIQEKDGFSSLTADLTNVSEENVDRAEFMILLYDTHGEEIQALPVMAGEAEPGSTTKLQFGTIINDLSGVGRIEVRKMR